MPGAYTGERWREARKAALSRDRVCQDCGTSEKLHVHHIRPVKKFDVKENAHDVNNLVVLCASCHRKWEGRNTRPNLLDPETGLSLSRFVHDLSKATIERQMDAPGPWILYKYFIKTNITNRYRCDYCFSPLETTRENTDHCPSCGREGKLWQAYDSPPDISGMRDRVDRLAKRLNSVGIPVDKGRMEDVVVYLWKQDEYYGRIEDVTYVVIRQGIRHGYNVGEIKVGYDAICPVPGPLPS